MTPAQAHATIFVCITGTADSQLPVCVHFTETGANDYTWISDVIMWYHAMTQRSLNNCTMGKQPTPRNMHFLNHTVARKKNSALSVDLQIPPRCFAQSPPTNLQSSTTNDWWTILWIRGLKVYASKHRARAPILVTLRKKKKNFCALFMRCA